MFSVREMFNDEVKMKASQFLNFVAVHMTMNLFLWSLNMDWLYDLHWMEDTWYCHEFGPQDTLLLFPLFTVQQLWQLDR
jgi:hypothetical protein